MNPARSHFHGLVADPLHAGGLSASARPLARTWLMVSDTESTGVAGAMRKGLSEVLPLRSANTSGDGMNDVSNGSKSVTTPVHASFRLN